MKLKVKYTYSYHIGWHSSDHFPQQLIQYPYLSLSLSIYPSINLVISIFWTLPWCLDAASSYGETSIVDWVPRKQTPVGFGIQRFIKETLGNNFWGRERTEAGMGRGRG